jgi:hypothetical protein
MAVVVADSVRQHQAQAVQVVAVLAHRLATQVQQTEVVAVAVAELLVLVAQAVAV